MTSGSFNTTSWSSDGKNINCIFSWNSERTEYTSIIKYKIKLSGTYTGKVNVSGKLLITIQSKSIPVEISTTEKRSNDEIYSGEFEVNHSYETGGGVFSVSLNTKINDSEISGSKSFYLDPVPLTNPSIEGFVDNNDNSVTINFKYGKELISDQAILYIKCKHHADDPNVTTTNYDYRAVINRTSAGETDFIDIPLNNIYGIIDSETENDNTFTLIVCQYNNNILKSSNIFTGEAKYYNYNPEVKPFNGDTSRIPNRPLEYENLHLAIAKELLADYRPGQAALYLKDSAGNIVNVTASADAIITDLIQRLLDNETILSNIKVDSPDGLKELSTALSDLFAKHNEINQSVNTKISDMTAIVNSLVSNNTNGIDSIAELLHYIDTHKSEAATLLATITNNITKNSSEIEANEKNIAANEKNIAANTAIIGVGKDHGHLAYQWYGLRADGKTEVPESEWKAHITSGIHSLNHSVRYMIDRLYGGQAQYGKDDTQNADYKRRFGMSIAQVIKDHLTGNGDGSRIFNTDYGTYIAASTASFDSWKSNKMKTDAGKAQFNGTKIYIQLEE